MTKIYEFSENVKNTKSHGKYGIPCIPDEPQTNLDVASGQRGPLFEAVTEAGQLREHRFWLLEEKRFFKYSGEIGDQMNGKWSFSNLRKNLRNTKTGK